MEKLYELHREGRFDLVVVDTPPTRHALDFLDAPGRLLRFLNNRVFRLLMMPTRASLRAIGVATQMFLRTMSKVVGGALVADTVAFFAAFEGMEQGFRDRAAKVEELLVDATTAFVVVASPAPGRRRGERCSSPTACARAPAGSRRSSSTACSPPSARSAGARCRGRAPRRPRRRRSADGGGRAGRQPLGPRPGRQPRGALRDRPGRAPPGTPVIRVPFLADDVHDVAGLTEMGRWLFDRQRGVRSSGATVGDRVPGRRQPKRRSLGPIARTAMTRGTRLADCRAVFTIFHSALLVTMTATATRTTRKAALVAEMRSCPHVAAAVGAGRPGLPYSSTATFFSRAAAASSMVSTTVTIRSKPVVRSSRMRVGRLQATATSPPSSRVRRIPPMRAPRPAESTNGIPDMSISSRLLDAMSARAWRNWLTVKASSSPTGRQMV